MTGLSVVIPSRNGREILERHLPAIERETSSCGGELVVVDDCSTDGSGDYLAGGHPHAKVLQRTGEPAFCRAVNLGMEAASGSFLLLLNNDTVPEKGSFGALMERLSSSDHLIAVAVPSIPRPDGSDDSLFKWGTRHGLAITGQGIEGDPYPSGACALWRREAWNRLGGLDCRYAPIYWEDVDLGVRMDRCGYRMIRCAEAVVRHVHAATMGASPETRALRERNRFIFMDAHGIDPGAWLPLHLVIAYLRGNRAFVEGYLAYRNWRRKL